MQYARANADAYAHGFRVHQGVNMRIAAIAAVVCAMSGALSPALAQQSVDLASISGRVTDPSGAVVPGARVTARQTQTNLNNTATTDQEGRFRFPYLRVGPYEITVRLQGFQDAVRHLTVNVGSAFELPVTLSEATRFSRFEPSV